MFKTFFFVVVASTAAAQARHTAHYSYHGNDSSRWTRSVIATHDTVAAADFSVFPCAATTCDVARMFTDAAGNTYVTGSRIFTLSSTTTASDVFVAKLDPSGATIFLATIGGKGTDTAAALGLDAAGNIYLAGSTTSPNFPLRNAMYTTTTSSWTGFLVKLSPDGSQLVYSTYFPGAVAALAVDSAGNSYVTGRTASSNFPVTPGMPNGTITGLYPGGVIGAFVAKLSPAGDKILYAGRIAGTSVACGCCSSCFLSIRQIGGVAIALDGAGNAYLAGNSNVTDLPVTAGVLSPTGIGAWVARVNAAGTNLDYLTYLGTANYVISPYANPGNTVSDLAVDAAGNAYITGNTSDPKFPATAGAYQSKYDGPAQPDPYPAPPSDAFVAKLNPQGTAMVWATFLGGSSIDIANAIALDSKGAVYVVGTTSSADFPVTTGSAQSTDYIAVLNASGSALNYSVRLPNTSVSRALAIDVSGRLRVADSAGEVTAMTLASPPSTRILGVADITAYTAGNSLAAEELVSVYGTGLANAQIQFDGAPGQVIYTSDSQVNVLAPSSLVSGNLTTLRAITGTATSPPFQAVVVTLTPHLFETGGVAAALNQDGSVNSSTNPAKFGSIVAVWATGKPSFILVNGELPEVLYAGPASGAPGVYQVNFRVPADLPRSATSVGLGFTDNSVQAGIYVTP